MSIFLRTQKNHGDNMVVAWIAIDELTNITMDIYEGTHLTYSNLHKSWNPFKYCSEWDNIVADIEHEKYNTHRIELKPGDVVFFQGLAFHRVRKTRGCKLDTCRRITVRYVDGEVTRWRNDIPPSIWPTIKMFSDPGKSVNATVPIVYDKKNPVNYNGFDQEGAMVPSLFYWFGFLWHAIRNGIKPSDIIFQCPKTAQEDNVREVLIPSLYDYITTLFKL